MSTEENKQLTRRFYDEVWNKGNLNAVDEYVSPDFHEHESQFSIGRIMGAPAESEGVEGVKQGTAAVRRAFPDLRVTVEDQIAEGDCVVTRWKAVATQTGPLGSMPPTGKRATVTGVWIDRISGGKIVESWEEYDVFGLLMQLGLIPTPERARA